MHDFMSVLLIALGQQRMWISLRVHEYMSYVCMAVVSICSVGFECAWL